MQEGLNVKVQSVSMHRPSAFRLEEGIKLPDGIINTYSAEFFQYFEYISDSRREWRRDIWRIVEEGVYRRLHILAHPFWYDESETGMKNKLTQFCLSAVEERYQTLHENIRDLQKELHLEEISAPASNRRKEVLP